MNPRSVASLTFIALAACGGGSGGGRLTAAPSCEVPAAPHVLARLSKCPGELALDDSHVYWLDGARLMRMPKCGSASPPEELLNPVHGRDLAVDQHAVFVADDVRLVRVDTATGETGVLMESPERRIEQVWLDGAYVYVSLEAFGSIFDPPQPIIVRLPKGGGAQAVVFSAPLGQVFDLVGDDAHLYFTGTVGFGVGRVPSGGGQATELLEPGANAQSTVLATDGDFVYYQQFPALIQRVPVAGGPAQLVVDAGADYFDLAVDDERVYWSVPGFTGDGGLRHAARSGGGEIVRVADGRDVRSVAVDHGAVYFGTCQDGDDAAVWLVRK